MPSESTSQPSMQTAAGTHRSFLLRCSRGGDEAHPNALNWHFSVREVAEKPQEHHFRSPGELLDFLLTRLGEEGGRAKHP